MFEYLITSKQTKKTNKQNKLLFPCTYSWRGDAYILFLKTFTLLTSPLYPRQYEIVQINKGFSQTLGIPLYIGPMLYTEKMGTQKKVKERSKNSWGK